MFNYHKRQENNWRDKLENIKAMREKVIEYSTNVPGLAPILRKELEEEQARVIGSIKAGAIDEFHAARATFEKKTSKFFDAQRHELARYDLPRVESEKAACRSRIGEVAKADKFLQKQDKEAELWAIYREGMVGDINRQRATAEVFSEIGEMNLPGQTLRGYPLRQSVGQYSVKAGEDLRQLHFTDEMLAVAIEADKAQNELLAAHQLLEAVGKDIGVNVGSPFELADPLTRAYREVRFSPAGKVTEMFAPDSPEITGVDLSRLNLESEK